MEGNYPVGFATSPHKKPIEPSKNGRPCSGFSVSFEGQAVSVSTQSAARDWPAPSVLGQRVATCDNRANVRLEMLCAGVTPRGERQRPTTLRTEQRA